MRLLKRGLGVLGLVFIIFLVAAGPTSLPQTTSTIDGLVEASVLVEAPSSLGSGVTIRNGNYSFIWTDAHVVKNSKKIETVIDRKTGWEATRCKFGDVYVVQAVIEDGRHVGEVNRLARIIRYSERHDIAILKVRGKNWPKKGVIFFCQPRVGESVWHVGSMQGYRGINSVSDGVVSSLGRLRLDFAPNLFDDPVIYDQVSVSAQPGCSGGGVFLKRNFQCIGLAAEYLGPGHTPGAVCIIPARRLLEFATASNCLWAYSAATKVPARDDESVMRDDIK